MNKAIDHSPLTAATQPPLAASEMAAQTLQGAERGVSTEALTTDPSATPTSAKLARFLTLMDDELGFCSDPAAGD